MLILARVCADFYDKNRNLLHRITPRDLNLFQDAPESIRQDPLFQMLVDDGSIKFPEDARTNRALENDPKAGTTPDGREIKPKAEPKAPVKAEAKTETKAEPKSTVKAADTRTK